MTNGFSTGFAVSFALLFYRYEPSINMLKVSVKDAHHQTLALSLEAMLQDESEPLRLEIAYSNGRWR
ncbi:DNA replication protein [Salmonella enterica subsp. enterica]|uniref:DNA replication protein n=1 Tax=Salmonella enterica I TaxID=59201 RepID=A0A3S4JAT5_SALET|nr:DNA replication protein [Salmonella enterica subsp. enterica]